MFERFTNRARHVVVLAQEEARRLEHNYIGTEHVLLGLLGEPGGAAYSALRRVGLSLDGAREEVTAEVGRGSGAPAGHIPFTPRAKKTLELALREAVQLRHTYIGTEHILLGVIREGDGVGARILRRHADLGAIRMAVLDVLSSIPAEAGQGRRWLRRRSASDLGEPPAQSESPEISTTPAADSSLTAAARLAEGQPVGSHHLLLAALTDADTAAARALAALGVDLEQARQALREADVAGTSDEQPQEAGRRQMLIRVTDDRLTVELTDPVIVGLGRAVTGALGDEAAPGGVIRGDLPGSAPLGNAWQALRDSLTEMERRATPPDPADSPDLPGAPGGPRQPNLAGKPRRPRRAG